MAKNINPFGTKNKLGPEFREPQASDLELLDIRELAASLKVSPAMIKKLVYNRKIPFLKIGRLVRFDTYKVRAWLGDSGGEG